jgi:hypothetical protein
MQSSYRAVRRAMPCHLCCQRKIDVVRIENWLLCRDCRRAETLDQVLSHLRNGDGLSAKRIVRQDSLELSTAHTFYTRQGWESD